MLNIAKLANACKYIILCYIGTIQGDLVPPSHFASSLQSGGAHSSIQVPATLPNISWIKSGVTSVPSGDANPANPWLAITQAQKEILELRKENQRIMMLQERASVDHLSDIRARYCHNMFLCGCTFCQPRRWKIGQY